jgi:Amino acid synthesis
MRTKNFGEFHVRKWYLQSKTPWPTKVARADGELVRKIVICVAVHNAFWGQFVEDLHGAVQPTAALGREFVNRLRDVIGSATPCAMPSGAQRLGSRQPGSGDLLERPLTHH